MEGLAVPFTGIAQGIVNLGNHFSNVLNYINPFSDNFILKGVLNFLGNMLSYINPFSENFLGKKIIELFSNLFQDLFIPKQDQFTELNNKINEKFGFIEQIKALVTSLFSYTNVRTYALNNSYPSWNITYEGVTISIIDFSVFDQYRGILHGIIIGIMYLSFLLRLFRRLPSIISSTGNVEG